jgi:predicted enzyme related to lactoylglutathione lyase
MPHAPGSFCWFECGTSDAAKAKPFYAKLFGWTLEDAPMPGDAGVYTLIKVDGEDIAGLYELSGPMFEGVPPHWLSYVAVENAADSARRAQALGATLLMDVMDVPNVGKMAFLKDPTGAAFAIFQAGAHLGFSDKTNLGWSELHTTDTARAKAFYTELFGWKPKTDANGMYTEWQLDGRSIGGMMEIPPAQREHVPSNWLPYAAVGDCDATLALASKMGATIVVPATDIEHVGRFGVFLDPTGACLAVIRLDETHV